MNNDVPLEKRLSTKLSDVAKKAVYGLTLLYALTGVADTTYIQEQRDERGTPLSYVQPHSYDERFHKERRDTLKFMQFTTVQKFPRSGNEGLYGFTFRDGKVNWRDDLHSFQKLKTDVHESIHTPNERETRYITDEILIPLFPHRKKYKDGIPEDYVR